MDYVFQIHDLRGEKRKVTFRLGLNATKMVFVFMTIKHQRILKNGEMFQI